MEVGPELRRGAVPSAGIDQRPDENAVLVQWERCYICVEILPVIGAHKKVLLDVRCVEGRFRSIVFAQVFTYGSKGRRSGKVSHNRHNQIVFFKTLEREEIFFGSEIASLLPVFVGIDHQLFICRQNTRCSRAGGKTYIAIPEGRASNVERAENVAQHTFVIRSQLETMPLHQAVPDGAAWFQ